MADAPLEQVRKMAEATLKDVASQKEKLAIMKQQVELAKALGEPVEGADLLLSAMETMIKSIEQIMGPVGKSKK